MEIITEPSAMVWWARMMPDWVKLLSVLSGLLSGYIYSVCNIRLGSTIFENFVSYLLVTFFMAFTIPIATNVLFYKYYVNTVRTPVEWLISLAYQPVWTIPLLLYHWLGFTIIFYRFS